MEQEIPAALSILNFRGTGYEYWFQLWRYRLLSPSIRQYWILAICVVFEHFGLIITIMCYFEVCMWKVRFFYSFKVFAIAGFAASVIWIYALAQEIVNLLKVGYLYCFFKQPLRCIFCTASPYSSCRAITLSHVRRLSVANIKWGHRFFYMELCNVWEDCMKTEMQPDFLAKLLGSL